MCARSRTDRKHWQWSAVIYAGAEPEQILAGSWLQLARELAKRRDRLAATDEITISGRGKTCRVTAAQLFRAGADAEEALLRGRLAKRLKIATEVVHLVAVFPRSSAVVEHAIEAQKLATEGINLLDVGGELTAFSDERKSQVSRARELLRDSDAQLIKARTEYFEKVDRQPSRVADLFR
jgi:hypothetical protein